MKSIEEIKAELMLKVLNGSFNEYFDIKDLPIDDDLRKFVSNISPRAAYDYALNVDKGPHDVTRLGVCKDPDKACYYAWFIDKCPRDNTRKAACKDPCNSYWYASQVDKYARDDTREAAYKDPKYKQKYIECFGE